MKKVAARLNEIFKSVGERVKRFFKKKKTYRDRMKEMNGEDPFICPKCGDEIYIVGNMGPRIWGDLFRVKRDDKSCRYGSSQIKDEGIRWSPDCESHIFFSAIVILD